MSENVRKWQRATDDSPSFRPMFNVDWCAMIAGLSWDEWQMYLDEHINDAVPQSPEELWQLVDELRAWKARR